MAHRPNRGREGRYLLAGSEQVSIGSSCLPSTATDGLPLLVAQSLCGLQSPVLSVVFDEKQDTIAAGGANGTIKIWEMETGKGEYRCSI
jgi:WD40 repeat protein